MIKVGRGTLRAGLLTMLCLSHQALAQLGGVAASSADQPGGYLRLDSLGNASGSKVVPTGGSTARTLADGIAAALAAIPSANLGMPNGPAVLGPDGTLGATMVKAANGNVARLFSAVLADRYDALFSTGIDPTGGTASDAGLNGITTSLSGKSGLIVLPSGNYMLGGTVFSSTAATWQLEQPNIHGGTITGCTDGSMLAGGVGVAWCRLLAGAGNEATVHVSALLAGQPNSSNTEKAAIYARVQSNDNSSYTGTAYQHDGVALEAQAVANNTQVRLWGGNNVNTFPLNMDGFSWGWETNTTNTNGQVGALDNYFVKGGFHANCNGPAGCSMGFLLDNLGTGFWQDGVLIRSTALASGGDAFALRPTGTNANDIAAIHADGSSLFAAQTIAGHVYNTGPAVTLGACGSGSTLAPGSSDQRGSVTINGTPTACTINWAAAYPSGHPPFCPVSSSNPSVQFGSQPAISGLYAPASTMIPTGTVLSWLCGG